MNETMEHEISVGRMKELLTELDDKDMLIPNAVGNLLVRNERGLDIGFIDLLKDQASIERY